MTSDPSPPASFSTVDLLEMYRRMVLIRGFEERVAVLYRDGEVPGWARAAPEPPAPVAVEGSPRSPAGPVVAQSGQLSLDV